MTDQSSEESYSGHTCNHCLRVCTPWDTGVLCYVSETQGNSCLLSPVAYLAHSKVGLFQNPHVILDCITKYDQKTPPQWAWLCCLLNSMAIYLNMILCRRTPSKKRHNGQFIISMRGIWSYCLLKAWGNKDNAGGRVKMWYDRKPRSLWTMLVMS